MSDKDAGNTEFILPIQCPHCKHELDLSMVFALLAPSLKIAGATEDDEDEDEDDIDDDIPPQDHD